VIGDCAPYDTCVRESNGRAHARPEYRQRSFAWFSDCASEKAVAGIHSTFPHRGAARSLDQPELFRRQAKRAAYGIASRQTRFV
jgi:hypothetical protein